MQYINGILSQGKGAEFKSYNPATGEIFQTLNETNLEDLEQAINSAKLAFKEWGFKSLKDRITVCEDFIELIKQNKEHLANTISNETGKAIWESRGEIAATINKLGVSIKAYEERTGEIYSSVQTNQTRLVHKPHGVVAVFAPFNFPAHLPNGHILPALIAGNTVVLKPSELTPWVSVEIIKLWDKALKKNNIYPGVINLVQGAKTIGEALSQHKEVAGLFFTGSSNTGLEIHKSFAGKPDKVLALELGGNNPYIVWNPQNIKAAAYMTIQSAFISSGQRCTCARRLIVQNNEWSSKFIDELINMTQKINIGSSTDKDVFISSLISNQAAQIALSKQQELKNNGAQVLLESKLLKENTGILSPGIIDVTGIITTDEEIFAPILQIIKVNNLYEAIQEANNTTYGLAAGILTDTEDEFKEFFLESNAGIINWNLATTGASASMPFGGTGLSGNHNPSAYYAADYCAYPVASMQSNSVKIPANISPGLSNCLL